MKHNVWRNTCIAGALLLTQAPGFAQDSGTYPTRPVRMIVPFAPGGASDFVGRIISPKLTDNLGEQIVIDNRGGAAGNIGVELAARSTPDGYNILLGNVGTMAINPSIYPNFQIRPLRDLIPITEIVDVPGSLVVNPSMPVKTVKELIAYAKANPGKLNFGSPGSGSANRLEMEFFTRAAGISMVHVPYKGGAGPAMIGLLGNEVQLMFVTLSSAITFVKGGKIRILGVVSSKRVEALPDAPTMAEQGLSSMTTGSWQGIFVPRGTPQPVVNKLYAATIKTMADAEVTKRLAAGGVDVVTSKSSKDFAAFVKAETERFAKVVKDAGVTAE